MSALISFAADPAGLPSWTAYPAIALLLGGISWLVTASIRGTITWPPEKKRMQDTIDLLVSVLQDANADTRRLLPTATRLVEVVDQRVVHPPEAKISRADLLAAIRDVASEVEAVTKND